MKIATWNVERLKHINRLPEIVNAINRVDADILVLTESDTRIELGYPYESTSARLDCSYYKPTERRVTVHSRFRMAGNHPTYSLETAICPEFETPIGNLLVYGTIIGIHGNRRKSFNEDLNHQLLDFERYSDKNLCIAGDFNMSFSDNYYHTNHGRAALNQSFKLNKLVNLTEHLPETIDHICVSKSFLEDRLIQSTEWNQDKTLSDHKGVCIHIES